MFTRFTQFTRLKQFARFTVVKNTTNPANRLNCFIFVLFATLFFASSAEARVTGPCSNCHTMHNSQNGQAMNFDSSSTPNASLLRGDCIGCHGQNPSGSSNIIPLGNIPQVLHAATTDLSGGNFHHIVKGGGSDTFGHNIREINKPDGSMTGTTPPGDEFNQTGITWGVGATFTCAGIYGCHGDRTISGSLVAVKGAHHTDDTVLKFGSISEGSQGGATGLSYRFLKGVYGGEDNDWQNTVGVADHNEYKGATAGVEGTISTPGGGTISGLCAECHGKFHGDAADIGSGPWLRHPTDIVLPSTATKEYKYYNGGIGTNNPYSPDAPVARATITNVKSGVVTPGTNDAIVMCLSCHRAHASPYYKMMRWDYKGWPGNGQTNGCNVCHTAKN